MANSRSWSAIWRWMAGSGVRRRSGRGGKVASGAAPADLAHPFLPFPPHQKAVAQHDQGGVAVKAGPQAALVLIPAQQFFGFFMKLFHPHPAVGVFHHHRQRRLHPEVAPEILDVTRLAARRALADQPTHLTVPLPVDAPTSDGGELGPQHWLAAGLRLQWCLLQA